MRNGEAKILIADRSPLFREAVAAALSTDPRLTIVRQAGDARQATASARRDDIDVAVLDQDLPGSGGPIEFVRVLRSYRPTLHVLIVGEEDATDGRTLAIEAGADGFVSRKADATEFVAQVWEAVTGMAHGSGVPEEAVVERLQERRAARRRELALLAELPPEDRILLKQLVGGMSMGEIAASLHVNVHTARAHVRRLLTRIGVTSTKDLKRLFTGS